MPYFFGRRSGDRVEIEGADARHLALSLRARPGQIIAVLDPPDRVLSVRLESVGRAGVSGVVTDESEHHPEPVARVEIASAMLPATSLELLLSRCTEAGAAGFTLVGAERSVARGIKADRWAAICREASMLAGRFSIPAVRGPVPLREALADALNPVLLDRRAPVRLAELGQPRDLTLFVGPEGGWTDSELALGEGRSARLGRRNLRAETAALAGLSIALAARGE